ncbi:hypothetical protein DFP74_4177 [Nocardiopsis sp. Huas11]|uniref:hypothetical protein n=1 Tax=Nocardiopsis sp. Huas11 TaxID=2183912 RepID=UPI000F1832E2|nr:hypothetical protein [Nocardiopsis sp. Huas11]RKS08475.1 hypothetical protein DFP74_4177 [Nocardiopsis sp. Huas11]
MKFLGGREVPDEYAENPYILEWWTKEHDAAVRTLIARYGWLFVSYTHDVVEKMTDPKIIDRWRSKDPLCDRYAYYNLIGGFALARAQVLGYAREMEPPRSLTCEACGTGFQEVDSSHRTIRYVGGRVGLRCCDPCFRGIFFEEAWDYEADKGKVDRYMVELARALGRVPSQGWERSVAWSDITRSRLAALVELCAQGRPSTASVKKQYGSWLAALIATGVLPNGAHKGVFGIRTLAKDGHVCNSLAEKTIDDWLSDNGFEHTKEPRYPDSQMRADFKVGGTLIEYFGLIGRSEYDEKVKLKRALARKHGIKLIEIQPKDMASWDRYQARLAKILG